MAFLYPPIGLGESMSLYSWGMCFCVYGAVIMNRHFEEKHAELTVECVMLSVTRAQPRRSDSPRQYDSARLSDIPFDYSLDSLSYCTIRFVKFSRFVKLRQNLDRAKLTPHWSTWRRHRNDSGFRATSWPYRLILADLLLYSVRDNLMLLSDLFRVKYANALSDISHSNEYPYEKMSIPHLPSLRGGSDTQNTFHLVDTFLLNLL